MADDRNELVSVELTREQWDTIATSPQEKDEHGEMPWRYRTYPESSVEWSARAAIEAAIPPSRERWLAAKAEVEAERPQLDRETKAWIRATIRDLIAWYESPARAACRSHFGQRVQHESGLVAWMFRDTPKCGFAMPSRHFARHQAYTFTDEEEQWIEREVRSAHESIIAQWQCSGADGPGVAFELGGLEPGARAA